MGWKKSFVGLWLGGMLLCWGPIWASGKVLAGAEVAGLEPDKQRVGSKMPLTVELFGADRLGCLWRFGARAEAQEEIGKLPAALVGLSFGGDGEELWGITADGDIWRVDFETLSGDPVMTAPLPSTESQFLDLAYVSPERLWLLRRLEALGPVELLEVNPATEEVQELGEIVFLDETLRPTSVVNFHGNPWVLDGSTAFSVLLPDPGLILPTATFLLEAAVEGHGLAVGADAVWFLGDFIDGRPGLGLTPRDGFGEPMPDFPTYFFSDGIGPTTLVSRIVSRDCVETPETLCLLGGRFQVQARWADSEGLEGVGLGVRERSDTTGQFWFFNPENRELMIKVLDGCGINGQVWVFLAGSTDVELTVTVTDTETGQEVEYKNPLGQAFETVLDTEAFAACGAPVGGGV